MSENNGNNTTQNNAGKLAHFYWIKTRSYVSIAKGKTERLDRGMYRSSKKIPMLHKAEQSSVEYYEGEIPQVKLYDIARHMHIRIEEKDGSYRNPDEILEELVTDI